MKQSKFDGLPGRTTIYDTIAKVEGKYPDWTFKDAPKASEALRRKNLIKQFFECIYKGAKQKVGRFVGRILKESDDSSDDRNQSHWGLQIRL